MKKSTIGLMIATSAMEFAGDSRAMTAAMLPPALSPQTARGRGCKPAFGPALFNQRMTERISSSCVGYIASGAHEYSIETTWAWLMEQSSRAMLS